MGINSQEFSFKMLGSSTNLAQSYLPTLRVQALRSSSRPSGTDAVSRARQPSDKSLGYCQMSLRDKRSDNVFVAIGNPGRPYPSIGLQAMRGQDARGRCFVRVSDPGGTGSAICRFSAGRGRPVRCRSGRHSN